MKTCILAMGLFASTALGQAIPAPYSTPYSFYTIGNPVGLPNPAGGLVFKAGDPNTLLIGGAANNGNGAIYSVSLTRDIDNRIIGFAGPATLWRAAPNIDGGLAYAPNGNLLYTKYPSNSVGQYSPAGVALPDTDMGPMGVNFSLGTLQFIPAGFPGAGGLVMASYNISSFHRIPFAAPSDGAVTFSAQSASVAASGGPEGIIFVPNGSPLMTFPTMLVSEYSFATISGYNVDSNGLPIVSTKFTFMNGVAAAEGAALDPRTNDFVFSTFGATTGMIVVRGFVPPPCNPADMGAQGGIAIQDGRLDNNDFVVFIESFFSLHPRADMGQQGGLPGADSLFDNNDFVIFIETFFSPCV